LQQLNVKTLYIEPGSPSQRCLQRLPGSAWENGYCESFNSKLRDELLAREIFYTMKEAQILIESWRSYYNTERPHSSLGYRSPAPETILPASHMLPYYGEAA
jgi:transposase InsO family protein